MSTTIHPTAADLKKRYRVIAGPYPKSQKAMLETVLRDLAGCRIHVENHTDARGATVWRLRSELETVEETAARLGSKLTPADQSDPSDPSDL